MYAQQTNQVPEALQNLGIDAAPVAIRIRVPKCPWYDISSEEGYESVTT